MVLQFGLMLQKKKRNELCVENTSEIRWNLEVSYESFGNIKLHILSHHNYDNAEQQLPAETGTHQAWCTRILSDSIYVIA